VSVLRAELVGEQRKLSDRLGDDVLHRSGHRHIVIVYVDNKTIVPRTVTADGASLHPQLRLTGSSCRLATWTGSMCYRTKRGRYPEAHERPNWFSATISLHDLGTDVTSTVCVISQLNVPRCL
jgi:hypothetical protein